MPLFSVAIPTFNRAHFLPEAIEAVLGQTYEDFELLVFDNASTDDTPNVINNYADARLRYKRHERNIGPLANFNEMIQQSRGDFFVLHQDDDVICPRFLERAAAAVQARDDVVIYASPLHYGNNQTGYRTTTIGPVTIRQACGCEPCIIPGYEAAIGFLGPFCTFFSPAAAFRTSTLRDVGGWYDQILAGAETVTMVRVLCRGMLAFDPQHIGGVRRHHDDNATDRMMTTRNQRRDLALMYRLVIGEMERYGVDWRGRLAAICEAFPLNDVLPMFHVWIKSAAPSSMQRLIWKVLWQSERHGSISSVRRMLSRAGIKRSARSLWSVIGSRD